ncbi:tRNA glutamyl-Q(34) synthetase GluQRS [Vulgatibacter incomptus]|uniref:Glutamyl-Q tRNA(Asp) synthetase n=1 Tax=Vulgatibacter incomptus TaxID=1391653 RepID=A0A0K1PI46_9BACT|nr:tRNA glutamyl-Q(34) synthetase GluQRS [Vulgatibacter incomptus]AKU92774.1 glutamyl-Q-tRNA synthetase [Vulgatibacter incomptus]
MKARGRYAPTPSGDLHLGNARTALLAWLSIRAQGGEFVLRMEDLDKPREQPGAAARILDSLRWLGLDWDEGPDVGGPHGSYVQSERSGLYDDAVTTLVAVGKAFPCWCSRAEVAAASRAPHAGEEGPRYPGTCRTADPGAMALRGRPPSMRVRAPEGPIRFVDRLQGPQAFDVDALTGDFVIRRADGVASYQLAVAVDDAAMGITEVLRGDDLLSSTPRQLIVYEALSLVAPSFFHVPLVLGPDGGRLAKRNGARSIGELREAGEDPKAICGLLAALSGLAEPGERVSPRELIARWDPERLPREPVRLVGG